jgi:uroporphyrinogen decarboxylase
MSGETPDRVPVTLFIVDQGHFLSQMYPEADPWDHESLQLKLIELQRQLGADVFIRVLYGMGNPQAFYYGGVDISRQTDCWEVQTEESRHGNTVTWKSTIRTPGGTIAQELCRNEIRPGTYVYACTKKPIKTAADLDIIAQYEPRMPESFPQDVRRHIQRLKNALGDSGILGAWSLGGPFNNASLLIDHQELYTLFLTDYEFYERLMNFTMDRVLDYVRAIDQAGVDVHCLGGNVPGGFLGRKTFDRYILPFEKKFIDFVQRNGTPAMYHNCGEIMNLVESYKELGARVVEPFSPPPLGDADLAQAKRLAGQSYAILAGIDQVNVLQKGTVAEVERATTAAMRAGKPGGGFILQPVDFLEYGTPPENVEAYIKTAISLAEYP